MNEEAKKRYYSELTICLRRKGFEVRNALGNKLDVFEGGELLCKVSGMDGINYHQSWVGTEEREKAKDIVYDMVKTVAEYMKLMETAPLLKADGLHEDYKLLADFNDAVLAGRNCGDGRGVQFVTWDWDFDRSGVSHGHYYMENYKGAKQDFTIRANLVPKQRIFNEEQLIEVFRCCEDTLSDGYILTDEQRKTIKGIQSQIEELMPDLREQLCGPAPAQEPHIIEKYSGVVDSVDVYWDDLLPETQEKILHYLGDNGNFDVFPLASIPVDPDMKYDPDEGLEMI